MTVSKDDFIKLFDAIARHKNRYEVFQDFVTMSAFSLHNACAFNQELEDEYMLIVRKYEKDDVNKICELFSLLIRLYGDRPSDLLGQLFMELEISNSRLGQFFTPFPISELMARLLDPVNQTISKDKLESQPFITISDPACGAGGMIMAFAKTVIDLGYDPSRKIWVSCIDIDACAAYMCFIQLSLWNIPAEVVVGNTLTLEFRRVMRTPAHYLGGWTQLLAMQKFIDLDREATVMNDNIQAKVEKPTTTVEQEIESKPLLNGEQFDFKF